MFTITSRSSTLQDEGLTKCLFMQWIYKIQMLLLLLLLFFFFF